MTGVLSEAVASVIERAAAGLGNDVCSVKRTESVQAGRRDTILTVTPANPRAGEITVHVDDDVALIDVTLGKGGFFEVKPRLDPASAATNLDEARALIYAGIRGRYRETVWMKGGEVVQSCATATIGTKVVPLRWRQLFSNPFKRALRKYFAVDPLGPERELETVVRCMHWLKELAEDSVTHDGDWDAWNNFTAVGAWYRIDWRVVTRWVGSARKEELTPADLESGRRMREQLGVPSF